MSWCPRLRISWYNHCWPDSLGVPPPVPMAVTSQRLLARVEEVATGFSDWQYQKDWCCPKDQRKWYTPEISHSPWKMMVGIRLFPFGARPIFRGYVCYAAMLVSGKLTWNPKMEVDGRWFSFPRTIFRFYVKFLGWKKGMECQEFGCGRFLFRMPVANKGLGRDIPKPKTCSNFGGHYFWGATPNSWIFCWFKLWIFRLQ